MLMRGKYIPYRWESHSGSWTYRRTNSCSRSIEAEEWKDIVCDFSSIARHAVEGLGWIEAQHSLTFWAKQNTALEVGISWDVDDIMGFLWPIMTRFCAQDKLSPSTNPHLAIRFPIWILATLIVHFMQDLIRRYSCIDMYRVFILSIQIWQECIVINLSFDIDDTLRMFVIYVV